MGTSGEGVGPGVSKRKRTKHDIQVLYTVNIMVAGILFSCLGVVFFSYPSVAMMPLHKVFVCSESKVCCSYN